MVSYQDGGRYSCKSLQPSFGSYSNILQTKLWSGASPTERSYWNFKFLSVLLNTGRRARPLLGLTVKMLASVMPFTISWGPNQFAFQDNQSVAVIRTGINSISCQIFSGRIVQGLALAVLEARSHSTLHLALHILGKEY